MLFLLIIDLFCMIQKENTKLFYYVETTMLKETIKNKEEYFRNVSFFQNFK